MTQASLAFAIPTRNRADMAMNAVRHLLDQQNCELQIFVSDNSSNEEEVRKLAGFCRELNAPRLTYMRPPDRDLSQGRHWDWASREALRRSNASHVTVHYDRKIFRPGQAAFLYDVASRHPGKVITYVSDAISVAPAPLRLWQTLWSGKLFAVKTARTLELSARGEAMEMGHTLPVLSNCVVPRAIVDTIVEQFGDLCISTTADSCFAYRFCALYDDYLHFDRALAILYGSHRSAGLGYLKGEGGDFADYLRTWHGDTWLDAAPIPGVNLGYNMLFHEYELVRRSPAGKRLPPLDREGYLRDLARGLVFVEDDQQREKLRRLLEEHGWKGELPAYTPAEPRSGRWRRVVRTLRQRAALFTAARFDRQPRSISGFAFRSDEEALHYALRFPRQPAADAEHLSLVEPVEVGMAAP